MVHDFSVNDAVLDDDEEEEVDKIVDLGEEDEVDDEDDELDIPEELLDEEE